jgi:hypothetical protein
MGLAHGLLLREQVRANVRAFLQEWAMGRRGQTRASLREIWTRIAPHIPAHYHAELSGLAEGSGVPLADLRLLHALPSRYHCTGTAATPEVTRDGKIYHTRSLDYALDIGELVRPQTNSLLFVSVPKKGLPHATVSWAGFLGCVTGMNLEGVSVGEMGSSSKDESYDGVPMIFLLKETLRTAQNLQEAKALWSRARRTCGYNFILCDPEGVCAVECNRSTVRFFGPGDRREDLAPHYSIPGVVRRCNHFVSRELAATQRDPYDPRVSSKNSWIAYERQGRFLKERAGEIDAAAMIELLRGYPPSHPCLHQAVMCPNDRVLWVSQAVDPATHPLAGAQNQPFVRYELRGLVAGRPAPALRFGRTAAPDDDETGRIESERRIEGIFAHEPKPFTFRLRPLRSLGKVAIHHLTYPSPGPSKFDENWTVHAEYYRPEGNGPFPSAIVLHILDGRFYVARMLAAALAQKGVAALFIKLPYYGERRPKGEVDLSALEVPDVIGAMRQGVRDIRRGAAWLRTRKEIDARRVGIVGVSLGSFVAQLAAGADGGFDRCAFLLGGGSLWSALYSGSKDTRNVQRIVEERGWSKDRMRKLLAPIEPTGHIEGIRRDGVLMINCLADEVVPPATTRSYWEAVGRPVILWYPGGHYALKDHVVEVMSRVTDHFDR